MSNFNEGDSFHQSPTNLPELHSDDRAVNKFAMEMKAKLAQARDKGRYGWDDPEMCSLESLTAMLTDHLLKSNAGNWIDIANFCMMLHLRSAEPACLASVVSERFSTPRELDKLEWSQTLLEGNLVTLDEAEKAVAKLGEGWRLPTLDELLSIMDQSCHDPAIDMKRFPDTKKTYYWTSTPFAYDKRAKWVVYFKNGFTQVLYGTLDACVRAVRIKQ